MFLRTLSQEKAISFDYSKGKWIWDMGKIRVMMIVLFFGNEIQIMGITDNVVDMMTGRIKLLPLETQSILSLASSIGNVIEMRLLSQVTELPYNETLRILQPALNAGLLLVLNEDFKWLKNGLEHQSPLVFQFLHDRVQQASYELIDAQELQYVHLKIGRLLLQKLNEVEIEEKLFGMITPEITLIYFDKI